MIRGHRSAGATVVFRFLQPRVRVEGGVALRVEWLLAFMVDGWRA